MSNVSRRVKRLTSGAPIGNLTRIGNGYVRDEVGRPFRLIDAEQDAANQKRRARFRDKRGFAFGHMRNMTDITDNLSNKYCGYILLLQPHIAFQTNVLVTEGRESTPLNLADLARIWAVSIRTARVVVSELEARSILFETAGTFTLNERYHFRKKATEDVDALIKTYFTALKSFDMKAADLGFVYKLLPYIHYDTNLVCADPFAAAEDIRFLTDGEMGEIVGLDERQVKAVLTRLRKSRILDEWINAGDKREKFTVINPYVFSRKRGEPDGAIAALFAKWKQN
ncbi:hypothetical protein [Paenibacillus humicus]|uniref:hypothetical protein n=1 Tax=Paenibacillus humicus TaxID=412861 RepID=UPI000FD9096E|nr:hypothetical protein [Paenibacillus humicus]